MRFRRALVATAVVLVLVNALAAPSRQGDTPWPMDPPVNPRLWVAVSRMGARTREFPDALSPLVQWFAWANSEAPPEKHLQAALAVFRHSDAVFSADLLMSWLWEESRFRYDAVSPAGALGVSQIMPETGEWIAGELLGVEWVPDRLLQDPAYAIDLGVAYLRWLYDLYAGDLHRTFTAYNRGPGGLEEYIAEHGTPASRYSSCILARVGLDSGERCQRTPEQEGE